MNYAGVIPECFGHDSTEEKLYAKYCNELIALALQKLGLKAKTIEERGDAPDIQARSENRGYSMVADAKGFRLSRTAKNPKDFKVEALNQWRRGANYALLVSPWHQYPKTSSQIYSQSIRYKVTLLSYIHLIFMIESKNLSEEELEQLWQVSGKLKSSNKANNYWSALNKKIIKITDRSEDNLNKALEKRAEKLVEQGKEQLDYWYTRIKEIKKLPHDEVVNELVKAKKINEKIKKIKKTV